MKVNLHGARGELVCAFIAMRNRTSGKPAKACQLSDLLADVGQQLFVGMRRAFGSTINPRRGPDPQRVDIRARGPKRLANGLHWPFPADKDERAIHFFQRPRTEGPFLGASSIRSARNG